MHHAISTFSFHTNIIYVYVPKTTGSIGYDLMAAF